MFGGKKKKKEATSPTGDSVAFLLCLKKRASSRRCAPGDRQHRSIAELYLLSTQTEIAEGDLQLIIINKVVLQAYWPSFVIKKVILQKTVFHPSKYNTAHPNTKPMFKIAGQQGTALRTGLRWKGSAGVTKPTKQARARAPH